MFQASNLLIAVLSLINDELERIQTNISQSDEYDNPFMNHAAQFKHPEVCFEVESYSWDETIEQPYNFKYKDIEIKWYKHYRRGTVVNKELTPSQINKLLNSCLESLEKYERKYDSIY